MAKNVLLICADDLYDWDRYRTRWGVTVQTPNFDRLLARGTKFANAFAPIAVCHPTRSATMSGYTPWQTGIFNNFTPTETVLTLDQLWPMAFRKAGYVMSSIGKVYHNTGDGYGADPAPWTFPLYDQVPTILSVGPNAGEHTATNFGGALGGLGFETGDGEFFDAQVAATFETFIANYAEERPFYFECGFFHPHEPRNAPIRFFEAVDYDNLTPPADWEDGWNTATFAADVFVNKPTSPPSTWSPAQLDSWKKDVGNYLAAVMHLDYQLGRVLDALEASNHDDNTIVAFFSDHGYELWSHGHFQKFTLWEQSCAVPLVVCDPDSAGGQVVTRPVSVMDVGPTLLDLAGIDVPSHHAGVSLKAAVEGGAAPSRMILSAWYSGASGRTDTHRITVYSDGSTEYFDLAADPWTQENLAPQNPAGMAADRAALLATAQDWGLLIVEEGVDISAPTPFAVYLGAAEQTKTKVGRAFVAYADLKAEHLPRGAKKVWVQPGVQNDVLRVPFGVKDIGVPHHLAGSKDTFTIHANAKANTFDIQDLNASFNLTMHLGEGDDRIDDIYGAYVVYAGPGNDYLWSWRSSPQEWHGGAGDDSMRGGSAGDLFVGGPGNDLLQGIGGADTLIGGPGDDTMEGGAGNDRLVLDGGSNQAAGGAGADTFVIHRTALLQTITNFDASDVIDLGDWANIGPVTVAQAGADVTITAALERIVVNSATAAAVASSITGVAVT